jgi:hypothetical protein
MKKLITYVLVNALVVVALYAIAFSATEVPSQIFSINGATVGVTTLDEVQKIYGMSEPARVNQEDEEADVTVCYVHPSPRGKSYLVFESGVMGGYKFITGFRISTLPPNGNCISTKTDVSALATRNGVRLGQSLKEFKKAVPVKFRCNNFELTYEAISQRTATQEELKRLRTNWPNEKQHYFDVTTIIKAKFHDNKLIDFYVHKIESY